MKPVDARFAEVYERHYRAVYAYCRRRTDADRVDDAVSETFLTAWRKIDQLPGDEVALPWLYAVAHRVLMHQWRSSTRRGRLEDRLATMGVETPPLPDQHVVSTQESRMVLEAASRLRRIDREILRLALWEELSHSEIAMVLDVRPDAARQRLSRALKNLTREFDRLEQKPSPTPVARKGGVR